ncbi:MAG: 16S rRNA (guanine(527)-N(7))-methyltransferase RsmG [Acidaminococcaceae bacterium]|nr:16S rRNA (guanine(527)-N(7))-methyltransferase RsmG [Acidaminococcaceae bacterium]MDD4721407.1 16S rRNA (guanine(527)-N(7))-methyltransferase RsmG [Acidaminococcaceae bacterium]
MNFIEALTSKGQEAGFVFTQEQVEKFNKYYEMLVETNKIMNLTTITEPEDVAVKHMIDSLLVYDAKRFPNKTLVDVGTGAGFPSIPLKIYCPSLKMVLMDSLAKRLKFLEAVITELDLKEIICEHIRAEDAGHKAQHREHYDIAIARAVASFPILAEYCLPLVKKDGYFYAMKGSKYKEELAQGEKAMCILGGKLISCEQVKLPGLDDGRAILVVQKQKNTPAKYPRKAGIVSKTPL